MSWPLELTTILKAEIAAGLQLEVTGGFESVLSRVPSWPKAPQVGWGEKQWQRGNSLSGSLEHEECCQATDKKPFGSNFLVFKRASTSSSSRECFFQIYCNISQLAWNVNSVLKVQALSCLWCVQSLLRSLKATQDWKAAWSMWAAKIPLPFRKQFIFFPELRAMFSEHDILSRKHHFFIVGA